MAQTKGPSRDAHAIAALTVSGFKSIVETTTIEIAPLTILAGTNSSGKSSAMQPLLLLKQTIEASYDPGPLELDASHVKFSATDQLLTKRAGNERNFAVGFRLLKGPAVSSTFRRKSATEFELAETSYVTRKGRKFNLLEGMEREALLTALELPIERELRASVVRDRCFLKARVEFPIPKRQGLLFADLERQPDLFEVLDPTSDHRQFVATLRKVIHLPGLRGNPERAYRTTAVEREFPGTFEPYVASIVSSWQQASDPRLEALNNSLRSLGLTWKIEAKRVAASAIELNVGRLPKRNGAKDLVNIADVGFGVSQALPVLVALLVAESGRLVYIEQPEIHLHPRAQLAMAEILVEAANRGVRVVCETHSSTMLLGLQTLVAQGKIVPQDVCFHWFERRRDGSTKITPAVLDDRGTYGDWPADFGRVLFDAENSFLDAFVGRAKT